ncbi:MAG: glycosyltransferase family 4 protein [Candidatus Marsarchaeota archaeon]|jgi:glycosyltransferase involved in cell wall biosynthesis|nr:glycosyltransferase family 4 protein [Candidatus Marsarchaeota archaeon]MCL5111260.1 glycosyltransferase family 4 protein [Candidatus Marsarchaeota archaeon]
MRVLLLGSKGQFENRVISGTDRYMYELAKNFKILKPRNIGIEKANYNTLPFFRNGFTPFIHSLIDEFSNYDIIHNLDMVPVSHLRYGNATSITTLHDFRAVTVPDMNPEAHAGLRGFLSYHLILLQGIKSLLNSDYLVANSTQTRNEAVKLGFDRRKIFVANHGIDERFLSGSGKKMRNSERFKVGYIGTLSFVKNLPFAIKAFMKVRDDSASFEIYGSQKFEYEKLAKLAGSDKRIRFMGFAPENKIISIYDSFDVFVTPTLYEGFCLPILEAQARGLPVVIYKKAILPEEVRRYCFEAEDEDDMARIIEEIRENGYDHTRMQQAKRYARGFTWMRLARQMIGIYRDIAKMQ